MQSYSSQCEIRQVTQIAATGTDGSAIAFEQIAKARIPYPVAFELAWQWVGYSRKDAAKRKLETDFHEGLDYLLHSTVEQHETGTKNVERIFLTVDCFKQFCMMAGTERGKQVRLHYLEIERKFKAAQSALATTPSHDALARALQGEVSSLRDRTPNPHQQGRYRPVSIPTADRAK